MQELVQCTKCGRNVAWVRNALLGNWVAINPEPDKKRGSFWLYEKEGTFKPLPIPSDKGAKATPEQQHIHAEYKKRFMDWRSQGWLYAAHLATSPGCYD